LFRIPGGPLVAPGFYQGLFSNGAISSSAKKKKSRKVPKTVVVVCHGELQRRINWQLFFLWAVNKEVRDIKNEKQSFGVCFFGAKEKTSDICCLIKLKPWG
jgi:hypothetical protein